MEPVDGYLETPEVRLHYLDWGGAGPPLLLLHATGFHARVWEPLMERLHPRFRVIALDERGHGDSGVAHVPDGYGWQRFTEDTHHLIEHLGIQGCIAAGHSAGGVAVAVCAGRFPGSISRALLIDPVLMDRPQMTNEFDLSISLAAGARRRRVIWNSPDQFEAAMRERAAFARWQPAFLHAYAQHGLRPLPDGRFMLKTLPEIEARTFEGQFQQDPWPVLDRLAIPTVLLRATDDRQSPTPAGAASRIPGCRETTVATSHFIPMEAPEAVLAGLEELLTL